MRAGPGTHFVHLLVVEVDIAMVLKRRFTTFKAGKSDHGRVGGRGLRQGGQQGGPRGREKGRHLSSRCQHSGSWDCTSSPHPTLLFHRLFEDLLLWLPGTMIRLCQARATALAVGGAHRSLAPTRASRNGA